MRVRRQLVQGDACLVDLSVKTLAIDLNSHAIVAAQVALGGRLHGKTPHVARVNQRLRCVVGRDVNERVRFHFRIEQSLRAPTHELHQLLQVIGESHVRGVALRYGLREGLGLQCRPFGLYALPGIGHAKRFAEVGIQGVHRGNLLLNLFLLRDYVAAARGVTAQKDERAAAVSEDLSLHGTQTLQVARAIELITGLAHLRIGETQVEEANQRGRNGHREDEPSEFLPELEAVEDLSDHQY